MRIIRTQAEHRRAFRRAVALAALDPEPDSPEGQRLGELAEAIEYYERMRYPFQKPTEAELAAFRAEQQRPR